MPLIDMHVSDWKKKNMNRTRPPVLRWSRTVNSAERFVNILANKYISSSVASFLQTLHFLHCKFWHPSAFRSVIYSCSQIKGKLNVSSKVMIHVTSSDPKDSILYLDLNPGDGLTCMKCTPLNKGYNTKIIWYRNIISAGFRPQPPYSCAKDRLSIQNVMVLYIYIYIYNHYFYRRTFENLFG